MDEEKKDPLVSQKEFLEVSDEIKKHLGSIILKCDKQIEAANKRLSWIKTLLFVLFLFHIIKYGIVLGCAMFFAIIFFSRLLNFIKTRK